MVFHKIDKSLFSLIDIFLIALEYIENTKGKKKKDIIEMEKEYKKWG